MRLEKLISIAITFLFIISCTDTNEEENKIFSINVKNESSNSLIFEGWRNSDIILEETILNNNQYTISYSSVNFLGLFGNIDSLVIKFDNNKGYICNGQQSNNLCFQDKNLFDIQDFNFLGNNIFEFVITQEDFDNAFDLP